MANDSTPVPEPQDEVTLETPEDGGRTTDGRGGYMSGQGTPGGGTSTGTGSGSSA